MPRGSVQLFQSSSATADANGNVSLAFPSAPQGRVWQGSISIIEGPAGQSFTLMVGGSKFGAITSPGPGGPYQFVSSQSISLTATLVTPGTTFVAVLSGTDDSVEAPTPYTGPVAVSTVSTGSP